MIELPFPPKQCSPNFKRRYHWTKYYRQVKKYRNACALMAKTVPIMMEFTVIIHPPHRQYDDDNLIAMFKAGQDGLADAWGVNDKDFRVNHIIKEAVKNGKIIIESKKDDQRPV